MRNERSEFSANQSLTQAAARRRVVAPQKPATLSALSSREHRLFAVLVVVAVLSFVVKVFG